MPKKLDKYHIDKAVKYNKIINNRSKTTLELDNYLEEMRNRDLKCCNNLSEKLLKYHTEIESEQRNYVNSVIKYNDKLIKLKKMIKEQTGLDSVLDLFMFDALEHSDTINDIYMDGINYGDKTNYNIKRDIHNSLNDIIKIIIEEDRKKRVLNLNESFEKEEVVNSQEELKDTKSIELIRIDTFDSLEKLEI